MRDYRYKIEYKSGKDNVVADQLSRPVNHIRRVEETWLGKTKEEIINLQRRDQRWREMINFLQGGRIPRSKYPRATLDQFAVEEEILYLCKKKNDGTILYLLVVPQELRKAAMQHIHAKESGHLGQHKSILKAEEFFYWPNLKQEMKQYVRECVTCQQFKNAPGLQQPWQELPSVTQPMERISIDVTDMGGGVMKYVLTIIDHYSRFVTFYPLKNRTAEQIIKKLDTLVEVIGAPRTLLTDNAREFCSEALKNWCRENRVKLVHSTPYHPQGNSISERMHRTMKTVLTTLCKGHPHKWSQHLKLCQRILNSAVHETTGEQPYYLMFNRRQPRLVGAELPQLEEDSDLAQVKEVIEETNRRRAKKWRDRANIGRKTQKVEEGNLVWIKRDYTTSTSERKFGVKWIGPYRVKEVIRQGGAYIVENVFDGTTLRRAADKVKPYVGQGDILLHHREVYVPEVAEDEGEDDRPRPRTPWRNEADREREAGSDVMESEDEEVDHPGRGGEGTTDQDRPRRDRRPVLRYQAGY